MQGTPQIAAQAARQTSRAARIASTHPVRASTLGRPLGKLPGKLGILSSALDTLKALRMQDMRDAGGGARTPDTRIMIRPEGCCEVSFGR
jgi:hypothetical protein